MKTYETWADVPNNLKTKTGLGKVGLRLSRGQEPVAKVSTWRKYRGKWVDGGYYDLYDSNQAAPKRKPTPKQLEALERGRERALAARTCQGCGRVMQSVKWLSEGYCKGCGEERGLWAYIEEARLEAIGWARGLLESGEFVVLDTETTGLPGEVVELAIVDSDGAVLINQRVCPVGEIEEGASAVHGLTKEMLSGCPTFTEIAEEVQRVLSGKTVIIYNEEFDTQCLRISCWRSDIEALDYESGCAMLMYSQFCGEYSRYWGNFKWQKLPGGDHSALGDALATLNLIKEMANSSADGPEGV